MTKVLAYIAFISLTAASCSSLKPAASSRPQPARSGNSPEFIENVSISPSGNHTSSLNTVSRTSGPNMQYTGSSSVTESLTSLQFKYGILINVAVEQLTNIKLLETIDEWYGARYRYGGSTKAGVDCSSFSCTLMTAVFGSSLPRTAKEQYAATQRVDKDELQEGDLVFFNTSGGISHVGVYLSNSKFVHASTTAGVMISDLNDDYYARKYVGAGRIL